MVTPFTDQMGSRAGRADDGGKPEEGPGGLGDQAYPDEMFALSGIEVPSSDEAAVEHPVQ
jgi:hypothetical protein